MTVTLTVDADQIEPDRQLYFVSRGDTAAAYQTVVPESEDEPDEGRCYYDVVQESLVEINPLDEDGDKWLVASLAGDFEWSRHRLWIHDRIRLAEWKPVQQVT